VVLNLAIGHSLVAKTRCKAKVAQLRKGASSQNKKIVGTTKNAFSSMEFTFGKQELQSVKAPVCIPSPNKRVSKRISKHDDERYKIDKESGKFICLSLIETNGDWRGRYAQPLLHRSSNGEATKTVSFAPEESNSTQLIPVIPKKTKADRDFEKLHRNVARQELKLELKDAVEKGEDPRGGLTVFCNSEKVCQNYFAAVNNALFFLANYNPTLSSITHTTCGSPSQHASTTVVESGRSRKRKPESETREAPSENKKKKNRTQSPSKHSSMKGKILPATALPIAQFSFTRGEPTKPLKSTRTERGNRNSSKKDKPAAAEAPSSAAKDTAPDSTNDWGDIFKVAEDTWQCNVCMVRNKDADTECVSCETPRPGHTGDKELVKEVGGAVDILPLSLTDRTSAMCPIWSASIKGKTKAAGAPSSATPNPKPVKDAYTSSAPLPLSSPRAVTEVPDYAKKVLKEFLSEAFPLEDGTCGQTLDVGVNGSGNHKELVWKFLATCVNGDPQSSASLRHSSHIGKQTQSRTIEESLEQSKEKWPLRRSERISKQQHRL
jgi:hypothetical protein